MSEEEQPKPASKHGITSTYRYRWLRPANTAAIKTSPLPTKFANKQVRTLYLVVTAFKVAMLLAIVLFVLIMMGLL
jgi:hypothetical protein